MRGGIIDRRLTASFCRGLETPPARRTQQSRQLRHEPVAPAAAGPRPAMSLLGMPWCVLNLGAEMVFILEQRLKAQGIGAAKAAQVLSDIVRTMLDPAFLDEKLFVQQEMYSLASTRGIFGRIAHSSIMRLSESSMDKLFDLMVMGCKYQLMCSTRLEEMLEVTLRHLGTVQAILATALAAASPDRPVDPAVVNLVDRAEDAAVRCYSGLGQGELALLRRTLARFFQDKRVKVSLFLAEGIQLQPSGRLVAPSCLDKRVGLVSCYDAAGRLESEERLQLASQQADPRMFFCHPTPLGDNLYRKDRDPVVPPQGGQAGPGSQAQAQADAAAQAGAAGAERYEDGDQARRGRAAAAELDLLAALVAVPRTPQDDGFRLNLFDDPEDEANSVRTGGGSVSGAHRRQQLHFGQGGRNDGYAARLLQGAGLHEQEGGQAAAAGGASGAPGAEDLLQLLDSVA